MELEVVQGLVVPPSRRLLLCMMRSGQFQSAKKIEYLKWSAIFNLSCLNEFDWPFVHLNVSCFIILVGHLREMHGKWPVTTCYFVLCNL